MIKTIIFDLDGVLIDSKEIHYIALNNALSTIVGSQYQISENEHLLKYDGLPTVDKLKLLSSEKGLSTNSYEQVWKEKQAQTFKQFNDDLTYNEKLRSVLRQLAAEGYTIAVASNSIRKTVKTILLRLGLIEFVDFYVSNEDVSKPKPHFEMFFKCMLLADCSPQETLILEDSHNGKYAALSSGANLMPISHPKDVTLPNIRSYLDRYNNKTVSIKSLPWQDNNLNVLIPMAGAGKRFQDAGYTFPKPLVDVEGMPMIQRVIKNLNIDANYIFIVQQEHDEQYNISAMLNLIVPGCTIVKTDGLTDGAASTTLLAKPYINNKQPLIIANSDQILDWDANQIMYSLTASDIDGGILTFEATHPKWSYARIDKKGWVVEVAEKKPISTNATCGIYYWKYGKDYVNYAEEMIAKDERVNGEFYVCPVFNEAIAAGAKIIIREIDQMWGIGTPEDLQFYISNRK